jgi:uncharacterized protein
MALISAATYPSITAVVAAFVPSHVIWEGIPPTDQPERSAGSNWTLPGKPLPYVRWSKAAEARGEGRRAQRA